MTLKKAKISVVIPTFMEEKYIATLLSELTRTRLKIDIVVVDSQSKDKTSEIARRYTEKVYQMEERYRKGKKLRGKPRQRGYHHLC